MKKLGFTILIFLSLTSCSLIESNQNPMCLIGSEVFTIKQKNGVDYLSYKNYSVQKVQNTESVGENYHVFDKDDVLVYKALDQYNYFFGIYKNFMFVDDGTGNIRQLMIIDLNTRKTLFNVTYTGEINLKNGKIIFFHPFIGENPPHKPNCLEAEQWGDMVGYIEKQIIDLNKNIIVKTGEIKCTYME